MSRQHPVVAIDGPTASGKSTVARAVADRLGLKHIDTGAMYRSVALASMRRSVDLRDDAALTALAASLAIEFRPAPGGDRIVVDGEDVTEAIRAPEVSTAASIVSAVPGVRVALVARQQALGAAGGIVMEGRDIGTVVFPNAEVKVFLGASLEARTRRRHDELRARGVDADLDEVRRQEAERDARDETRSHSPLRPADDAVILDTTLLTLEQVVAAIVQLVRERSDVV
ncbi:MAG: (d)CMP kinase [bacterium]|nr:(d)CMP kinase [bacterium]